MCEERCPARTIAPLHPWSGISFDLGYACISGFGAGNFVHEDIAAVICSGKLCKVSEDGNSASNVAPGVFLGMHPLDVLFDLWT